MIKRIFSYLKEDYNRRMYIFAALIAFINLAFAIYNEILGIVHGSLWHISIGIYYLLLMCVRELLIFGGLSKKNNNELKQNIILYASFVIITIITIAMIAPAILLIQDKREFSWGLVPAIVMASYTTYSITIAIINMSKVKSNDNNIVKQVRLINMIAALMSILVLQNTLIKANGGYTSEMKYLSMYTSIAIILSIVIIVLYSFIKTLKKNKA